MVWSTSALKMATFTPLIRTRANRSGHFLREGLSTHHQQSLITSSTSALLMAVSMPLMLTLVNRSGSAIQDLHLNKGLHHKDKNHHKDLHHKDKDLHHRDK